MTTKLNKQQSKWKRFSGASYAAFQSLHREVRIGVLTVAMLTSAGLKATAGSSASVSVAPAGSHSPVLVADGDSLVVGLEDVEVLASRVPLTAGEAPRLVTVLTAVDIAAAAVHSVNDLLDLAVGVDVRQRGEFGVQTDISVRGGTYDQITLLLNGVNISSPHTGHLSADFPVSPQDIERIEVLEGSAARVFGTSAFTGVINIVTRRDSDAGQATVYGGSYGYAGADLRLAKSVRLGGQSAGGDAATPHPTMTHRLSGGYSRADGATPNSDFQSSRVFYQGELSWDDASGGDANLLSLQLGYSYKPYGANTFYGAASQDQWESNERYMGALSLRTQAGRLHLAPQVYWNRWFDHYQWHKDSPVGENYHQVDAYGAALNGWVESRWGKTSLGVEMRSEGIYSTKLGRLEEEAQWRSTRGHDGVDSTLYKYSDARTNVSAFLEHNVLLRHWTLSAGVLANMNTGLDHRWRLYPGVDVAWRPLPVLALFASWNMALRMPTFTDLYYSGVGIEGNSNLSPERTSDVTLGARWRRPGWKAEAAVFYSHKSDMIDWVVYDDETWTVDAAGQRIDIPQADWVFRSGNFSLDNVGFEVNAAWLPGELYGETRRSLALRRLGVAYAYINEDIDYGARAMVRSKYAMEYLRHKVVIDADVTLWRQLSLSASWRWQDRVGEGNAPYGLVDARLSWNAVRWTLYADCSNLLDKTYYDYNIVPQPGRWLKVGATWRFGL